MNRQHLTDDCLIGTYFAASGDESAREALREECEHVRSCEQCRRRLEELTAPLERLRQDASIDADEYFTGERLAAQRDHVLRHLEGSEHPAVVIPFPHAPARPSKTGSRQPVMRWIAASAAAGLLIGVTVGRFTAPVEWMSGGSSGRQATSAQRRPASAALRPSADAVDEFSRASVGEEAFLLELESAVNQQRIPELTALDALTPHVREAVVRLR
jgi:hypothetical protein